MLAVRHRPLSIRSADGCDTANLFKQGAARIPHYYNGVRHICRAAAAHSSPQPFLTEDLPVLNHQFYQRLTITTAMHRTVYNFERMLYDF